MTTLRLHPEARDELAAAAAWYEERRPGYGAVFIARVRTVVRFIEAAPTGGTRWRERAVRTWRVPRFPFVVVYSVESPETVVLAIAHTKRKPGYWATRHGG